MTHDHSQSAPHDHRHKRGQARAVAARRTHTTQMDPALLISGALVAAAVVFALLLS